MQSPGLCIKIKQKQTKSTPWGKRRQTTRQAERLGSIMTHEGTLGPVYTWHYPFTPGVLKFKSSLLSSFNHVCPDFFEGRVNEWVNVWALSDLSI